MEHNMDPRVKQEEQRENLSTNPAQIDPEDKYARAAELINISGHPLNTLTRENNALTEIIKDVRQALEEDNPLDALLAKLAEFSQHYAHKGDILYPHLKVKYGIAGPSDLMWTTDDEIRDEFNRLRKSEEKDSEWKAQLHNLLTRIEEMIYQEQNILFPICAVQFSEDEWKTIYQDSLDYPGCFGVSREGWEEAKAKSPAPAAFEDGEIVMPGGHMTIEQLTAMLNTIPLEITFVDAADINRYFNEGPKIFKRPSMAIDRSLYSCHPPKVEPMVRSIIESFRSGKRDTVPVWSSKGGHSILITYMAVRDRDNNYLGTLEIVQDLEFAKDHFTKE